MKKPDNHYAWVVCYVNKDFISTLTRDLAYLEEYKDIEPYIPMVKVLKKQFKGEDFYEDVPLLFNYGFFRIPRFQASSRTFLDNMKANISCIFAWVGDHAKVLRRVPTLTVDNKLLHTDWGIPAATASAKEIDNLVKAARENTIFSATEVDKLEVGNVVTLRGYPWDGMDAKIIEVDMKHRKVTVSLLLFQQQKEVKVPFESVFFTVYHNEGYSDEIGKHKSLEELREQNVLDAVTKKLQRDE